jgi:hypothetical protein
VDGVGLVTGAGDPPSRAQNAREMGCPVHC